MILYGIILCLSLVSFGGRELMVKKKKMVLLDKLDFLYVILGMDWLAFCHACMHI